MDAPVAEGSRAWVVLWSAVVAAPVLPGPRALPALAIGGWTWLQLAAEELHRPRGGLVVEAMRAALRAGPPGLHLAVPVRLVAIDRALHEEVRRAPPMPDALEAALLLRVPAGAAIALGLLVAAGLAPLAWRLRRAREVERACAR